jgi:hypothetical protein
LETAANLEHKVVLLAQEVLVALDIIVNMLEEMARQLEQLHVLELAVVVDLHQYFLTKQGLL